MTIDLPTILSVANVIILLAIALFVRSYLPSYFGEKGRNLATKEDVADITERIEKVRSLYSTQTEANRSMINEIQQVRDEYFREQRSCLLKFYDLTIELFYEKLAVNFGDMPLDQGQSLSEFQKSFFALVSELVKSYQRIVVYFNHDDKLRSEAENVLTNILQARIIVKKYFGKVKLAFIEETEAVLNGDQTRINLTVQKSNEANSTYWENMDPVMTKLQASLRQYLTAVNEFLKPGEISQIPKDLFL